MPNEPLEELLTTRRAAPLLGMAAQTLVAWRCLRRPDQPPYVRIGRSVRYRPSEIRRWMESRQRGPMPPGA